MTQTDVVRDMSLAWLTLSNAGALQVVEAAAFAGFRKVSIRLAGRFGGVTLGGPEAPGQVEQLHSALDGEGITLSHMGGVWLDGQAVASYEPAIALGARLGASACVAIFTPQRPMDAMRADFDALCRLAGAYGLRVAVEFAMYTGIRTLSEANALIEATDLPNAGILLDALHFFRSGGQPDQVAALPHGRLHIVQLCDAPLSAPALTGLQTEARGNRLDLGVGELPLRELVAAVPAQALLEIEAPCLAYRNKSHAERAYLAAQAARLFFAHEPAAHS